MCDTSVIHVWYMCNAWLMTCEGLHLMWRYPTSSHLEGSTSFWAMTSQTTGIFLCLSMLPTARVIHQTVPYLAIHASSLFNNCTISCYNMICITSYPYNTMRASFHIAYHTFTTMSAAYDQYYYHKIMPCRPVGMFHQPLHEEGPMACLWRWQLGKISWLHWPYSKHKIEMRT